MLADPLTRLLNRENQDERRRELEQYQLPPLRLVICREDLPPNPRWREWGYPGERCWDVAELMLEGAKQGECMPLWHDARRIAWEMLHRAWSTYRRGRPFPDIYWCDIRTKTCIALNKEDPMVQRRVMMEIVATAFEFGILRRGVGIFRMFLGRPFVK